MAIAMTLKEYLADQTIAYDVVEHPRTLTASRAAEAGHVPGERLAKAVLVKDEDGFIVAVLPAAYHIELGRLGSCLRRRVGLATEREVGELFGDCELGAIPPVGAAYGLEVIIDDSLADQPDVFFEAGDHETLVHVSGEQFRRLMGTAAHGQFSRHD
ncbi:MAG: aminoacyl-tRNA deacylase [Dongiaceae bacterium]